MSDYPALIASLESLEEWDRGIDAEIHLTANVGLTTALHYTFSIDSAITLVPEGWWWEITQFGFLTPSPTGFKAMLFKPDRTENGVGATAAIAICVAALRARQATEGA